MSKTIKKVGMFIKPSKEEVIQFIDVTMRDWPRDFCEHMGEKFFEYYQSTGWRLSHNILMKDWHAAWHSRWKQLKFKEDIQLLEKLLRSPQHLIVLDERRRKSAGLFAVAEGSGPTPLDRFLESLDDIFRQWQIGKASDSQLRTCAEWLRKNNLLLLSRDQIDRVLEEQGNNGDLGKILAIRQFFVNRQKDGLSISAFIRGKMAQTKQSKTA